MQGRKRITFFKGEHGRHKFKTTWSYHHSGLHFYCSSSKKCPSHFCSFFFPCGISFLSEIIRCWVSHTRLFLTHTCWLFACLFFFFFSFGNHLVCNFSHRHKGAADCRALQVLGVRSKAGCPAFLPGTHIPFLASYLVALKWCLLLLWDRFLFDSHSQTHKLCLNSGRRRRYATVAQMKAQWRWQNCFVFSFIHVRTSSSVPLQWGNMHTTVLWALDWDCSSSIYGAKTKI